MWLTDLEADRVRNLKALSVSLPAGLTVVVGRNGQGKTSLLEAVYLLGTGRSFRTRRLDDLVAWKGGPLRVSGSFSSVLGRTKLSVLLDTGTRHLLVDGVDKQIEDYLGRLDLVDLTAQRMDILRGSPLERRRFLDRGVVGLRPDYLRDLGEYRRVLAQRNALLRRNAGRTHPQSFAELDAWDERLEPAAFALHRERRRYATRLAARLGEISRQLLAAGQELRLRYRASPAEAGMAPVEHFGERFRHALVAGRSRDLVIGHTCQGPHRDEMAVELNGVDLRRFGSAGQVRSAMIALKVGKLGLLKEERGEVPLFLMDDFDTDLDEVRAAALASFLQGEGFQALVATSKDSLVGRLGVAFTKLRMDDGVARTA